MGAALRALMTQSGHKHATLRRVLAVLLDKLVGGAVGVDVGGHLALPATALIMAARCF